MDTLYIVMPAYNEEENIREVVMSWYPKLKGKSKDSRMIIADSGSTDNTHDILLDLQKEYPQIVILSDTEKQHGPKLMALYDYAVKKKADYVFQTDSDGQTDPDEFNEFWMRRKEFHAVLGHRRIRGDGKARAFVEHVVCGLLRLYFGVRVPDANAPFRLMNVSLIKKYLYNMPEDYNLPNIMLTTYFAYYQEKIAFKTITFKPRQGGINSVDFVKIIKIGWKALGEFRIFKKNMKERG